MIAITAKEAFGAWPLIVGLLAAGLALDGVALWRYRGRRAAALVLGGVGVCLACVTIVFVGLLASLARGG